MQGVTDDKLLSYNGEGLIPGPGESEEAFARRADYCLRLKEFLAGSLPFATDGEAPPSVIRPACAMTASLYDSAPSWVPLFFSNYRLFPWHGGCAWIFQLADGQPTSAFFQLRSAFKTRSKYLGIYDRDELIAHELVHVGRMMFEEPRYEEVLAYRTSHSWWRRWLGPIVQSSAESAWFVFLLLPIIFLDLYFLLSGHEGYFWQAMWLKILPLLLVVAALVRLWRRQSTFQAALKNVAAAAGSEAMGSAVVYRLSDGEIDMFAAMAPSEIRAYADTQKCLRWRLIRRAYFS